MPLHSISDVKISNLIVRNTEADWLGVFPKKFLESVYEKAVTQK